jgi:hypothetical protein
MMNLAPFCYRGGFTASLLARLLLACAELVFAYERNVYSAGVRLATCVACRGFPDKPATCVCNDLTNDGTRTTLPDAITIVATDLEDTPLEIFYDICHEELSVFCLPHMRKELFVVYQNFRIL